MRGLREFKDLESRLDSTAFHMARDEVFLQIQVLNMDEYFIRGYA